MNARKAIEREDARRRDGDFIRLRKSSLDPESCGTLFGTLNVPETYVEQWLLRTVISNIQHLIYL